MLVVAIGCTLPTAYVHAQLGGSTGLFGQGGASSLGQGFGGTTGSNSFGGGGGGAAGGAGGVGSTQAAQQSGQITGNERFLEANRQGAFVGTDSGDATNALSNMNGQQGAANPLQGLQNLIRNAPNLNNNANNSRTIRARVKIGFQPQPVFSSAQRATVTTRMMRLPRFEGSQIAVLMEGETAILRGTVDSEQEKTLAAGVVRLEPGVWDVRNELIVDPDAAKVEGPANLTGPNVEELAPPKR